MFKLHAAIPLSELAHLVQETFDSFQFVRPTCRFRRGLRGPIPPCNSGQKGVKERGIYTRFSHGTDYHSIVKGRGDAPRLVLQCLCFIL